MNDYLASMLRVPAMRCYRAWREWRYQRQPLCSIRCGAYVLKAPITHVLSTLGRNQPLRDLCVGVSAKCVTVKYPEATLLDVGANIGDTAAMMATYTRNKIIVVEPSDYYLGLLRRNLSQLPNEILVHKAVIADGADVEGTLRHGSGTAVIKRQEGVNTVVSKKLSEVADENTRFVKLDTDGFDFRIIEAAKQWLAKRKAVLLFEDQIRNEDDLFQARRILRTLETCGYTHFIVWDDPGNLVVATTSLDVLDDLNKQLCATWKKGGGRSMQLRYIVSFCRRQGSFP